jgi:hypothetical protein
MTLNLLEDFAKLRQVTASFIVSVYLSVRPHETTRFQLH